MTRYAVTLALILALACPWTASAQVQSTARYWQVQTVTNAATFTVCTAGSTPAGCYADVRIMSAYCTVETAAIRWLATGTPTTTAGHVAQAGTSITITGRSNVLAFKMIASAASASVTCEVLTS